jgi:hypothetical protein
MKKSYNRKPINSRKHIKSRKPIKSRKHIKSRKPIKSRKHINSRKSRKSRKTIRQKGGNIACYTEQSVLNGGNLLQGYELKSDCPMDL